MDGARRHKGQLHQHSSLRHHGPFDTASLVAGTTFEADLGKLLAAVRKWEDCLASFNGTLDDTPLTAPIQDGTGPVAHALGARFNHRIGGQGGIGYAAMAYAHKLEQILVGLTQTTDNLAQTEENTAAAFTDGTVTP